ncbi:alpha/beta-hydrolase [Tothia fuscella]|uniref:Alpha/beta-hydrolase n=1 Tax=Tothia fuscella TaxID=1048955 RepID=A0A9P4NHF1_9PEZI|nr:alpha/beta-hydrolase [Tothia fuscella]
MKLSFLCLAVPIIALSVPGLSGNQGTSPKLEERQSTLPLLKLPYGTWQALSHDRANDIYLFKNIRFATPPVGDLRFAKPAPPIRNDTIQTGAYGNTCVQSNAKPFATNEAAPKPGTGLDFTGLLSSFLGWLSPTLDLGLLQGGSSSGEDCLFLDLYVPGKALNGSVKLPIINWLYGGANIFGSKDGIYAGTGIIKAAGGDVIFVGANYRLGAFGFLGGETVEKDGGTPNAGLWDQRAVFQWIQDYAPLFGGDPKDVSAWGESAGAAAIMHHLTAFGGKKPSLFRKAVINSPGFDNMVDRNGHLEVNRYKVLERFAGCEGKGLPCLRALDWKSLKDAQDKYINFLPAGPSAFGPVADGVLIRQVPSLEFISGNYAKDIDSIIISHVAEESDKFIRGGTITDADFLGAVQHNLGSNEAVNNAILKHMPTPAESNGKFKSQRQRVVDYIQFASFTCNVRFLSQAYQGKTWNAQYSRGDGSHASDVIPLFYDAGSPLFKAYTYVDPTISKFGPEYHSYYTSHTKTGDPNTYRINSTIPWPKAKFGPAISNVLNMQDTGYQIIDDTKTTAEDCDFWRDAFAALTISAGWAPPDAVVPSSILGNDTSGASRNFIRAQSFQQRF